MLWWAQTSIERDDINGIVFLHLRNFWVNIIYAWSVNLGSVETTFFHANPSKLCKSIIQYTYWESQGMLCRLANTMLRVLRNARIPLFLHRKSNHIFTVWQHMVLLVIRQYEGKSYWMFAEWLVEAYYFTLEHFSNYHMYHISSLFRNSRKESVEPY